MGFTVDEILKEVLGDYPRKKGGLFSICLRRRIWLRGTIRANFAGAPGYLSSYDLVGQLEMSS